MRNFVLVPGAWHGGWCWRRLVPLLREAGHAAHPITLTGLGERAHLATPETGLEVHVRDVLGVLECEDLREVILVGHSYAGCVAAGVAARAPERLARLAILDGFLPADGQSLGDLKGAAWVERIAERAHRAGCAWLVPPPDNDTFGVTDPADADWLRRKLTPHPLRAFLEPVRIARPLAREGFGKTYIQCRLPGERAWETPDPAFERVELEAGHDAMLSAPRALADLLLKLA
ncbi:MAG: alpha/beta fold hydrolase [Planctomycetota bacterium]|nr:alpha/beta fold hydrolase [Planctomycetota bacterium]